MLIQKSCHLQAARKRPALASMLSHRWLQPPTPPSTPASFGASQPPAQLLVSPTPLPGPPGPLLIAPSPPGPASLALTPTDAPGVQSVTPPPEEGRHHVELSRGATAFEEMSASPESMAAHSESRLVEFHCMLVRPSFETLYMGCSQAGSQPVLQNTGAHV